jgi:hypothetical protein
MLDPAQIAKDDYKVKCINALPKENIKYFRIEVAIIHFYTIML